MNWFCCLICWFGLSKLGLGIFSRPSPAQPYFTVALIRCWELQWAVVMKSGGPIIPLLCLLKYVRQCSHARQGQIAVPRRSILPHSALYPPCNPIHTQLSWGALVAKSRLSIYFISNILIVNNLTWQPETQMQQPWQLYSPPLATRRRKNGHNRCQNTPLFSLSVTMSTFFNASTPTNPQNPYHQ